MSQASPGGKAHGTGSIVGTTSMPKTVFHRVQIKVGNKDLSVMVGRKRKQGKRERNGRVQREPAITPLQIAATMPHRRWLPLDKDGKDQRADQRAENPFGRLNLTNAVTDLEYDAGIKYRDVFQRYRATLKYTWDGKKWVMALGCPNPFPGAISLDGMASGSGRLLDSGEIERRRNDYARAFEAIEGHRVRVVIKSVVIFEKELQPGDLPYLRMGLGALVKHYGLAITEKRVAR